MRTSLVVIALALAPTGASAATYELSGAQCRSLANGEEQTRLDSDDDLSLSYKARVRPDVWIHHSEDALPPVADPGSRWRAPDLAGWHLVGRQLEHFRLASAQYQQGAEPPLPPPVEFQRRQRALYDVLVHQVQQAEALESILTSRMGNFTDPKQRAGQQSDGDACRRYASALRAAMVWVVELDDQVDGEGLVEEVSATEGVMPALLERHVRAWLTAPEPGGLANLTRVRVNNCLSRRLDTEFRVMGRYEGAPVVDRTLSIPARHYSELNVSDEELGIGPAEVYLAASRGEVHTTVRIEDDRIQVEILVLP